MAVLVPAAATSDGLTPFVGRSAASSGMDTATHVGVALGSTSASGIGVEGEFSNVSKPFPAPLGDGGGKGLLTINYGNFINDPRHNVAFNAGGGVRVGSGRLSVRADLRCFRTLTEQENVFFPTNPPAVDYWRTAIGVTPPGQDTGAARRRDSASTPRMLRRINGLTRIIHESVARPSAPAR